MGFVIHCNESEKKKQTDCASFCEMNQNTSAIRALSLRVIREIEEFLCRKREKSEKKREKSRNTDEFFRSKRAI